MNEERTTSRKTRVGKVVSDKMDKTVVVIVEDRVAHPYGIIPSQKPYPYSFYVRDRRRIEGQPYPPCRPVEFERRP